MPTSTASENKPFLRGGVYYGRFYYVQPGWCEKKQEVVKKKKSIKKSHNTSDPAVAARRHKKFLRDMNAQFHGEMINISYDEAKARYWRRAKGRLKPTTIKRYASSFASLDPYFTGKSMHNISTRDLAGYEEKARRRKSRYKGKKLTESTILRDLWTLSKVFQDCVYNELIPKNIVRIYIGRRKDEGELKEAPPREVYLETKEEEQRLMQTLYKSLTNPKASRHIAQMRIAAVLVSIDAGLREDELLSLKNVQIKQTSEGWDIELTKTKTDLPRIVPLTERAQMALQELPVAPDGKFVFWHIRKGEVVRFGSFRCGFNKAVKKAKLDIIWHDLRRTCGCRLLQDGIPMKDVSVWLGHTSITTTERHYAFLKRRGLRKHIKPKPIPQDIVENVVRFKRG